MPGLAAAFKHFGAVPNNPRWSWSARSPDGKTVVLALWSDRFRWKDRPLTYDGSEPIDRDRWSASRGNQERLGNLRWARDNCDGLFRVVMVIAVDPAAVPRAIETCFPREDWMMRLTALDETSGEFQAIKIGNG
jgi:hypothetical protein